MEGKYDRFESLRLLPGHNIQLDFDGSLQDRAKSVLIGYNVYGTGQSIIVTTPYANGSPLSFKVGAELTVRLFVPHLSCACAFRTEVLHISRAPYSLIYLSIPQKMIMGEVRSSVRAKVKLTAVVYCGEDFSKQYAASIQDMSLGGARLTSKMLPVAIGDRVRFITQVRISDIDRLLTLHAQVRSVTSDGNHSDITVGVQFVDLNEDSKIALYAYVMSNMYQ